MQSPSIQQPKFPLVALSQLAPRSSFLIETQLHSLVLILFEQMKKAASQVQAPQGQRNLYTL